MTLDLFEPTSITQKERVNSALGYELPPHKPGVYTMYDKHDQVLYIGKAKDLQQRITSYRYSNSRKVQRMIAHVERISYETCKDETDAILLENLLIRSIRPPFNHANKKPETYYYISSVRRGNMREFRLSMRIPEDYPKVYGCFKGHLKTRRGLGALFKLLYLTEKKIRSAHYLPNLLLNRITPMVFQLPMNFETGTQVHQFLSGTSAQLIKKINECVDNLHFTDTFTSKYFRQELEMLHMFYTLGPERNFKLKQQFELDTHLIDQDKLDDLTVLMEQ